MTALLISLWLALLSVGCAIYTGVIARRFRRSIAEQQLDALINGLAEIADQLSVINSSLARR